jgi:tetratricopeptide (TPR) repeat protein
VRALSAGLLAALALSGLAQTPRAALTQANAALQAGETDKALTLLQPISQSGVGPDSPDNATIAEAHNLTCRVQLTLERWDAAIAECEKAATLDAGNSNDHMWLARALGEKADRASFLSAYSLAKRVRAEFETAVQLNDRNAEAQADLGEFYCDAPGVIGGGLDKAETVAAKLDRLDPARAHMLRSQMAEQRKDYDAAEREIKLAIAASPHPAAEWMDLAGFYRRRQRLPEMESAVRSGAGIEEREKHADAALYNGAGVLLKANRQPALAAKMLEDYLAGTNKTEEAPAFVAWARLARLRDQLGDAEAAKRDRAAAQALAHDYKPRQSGAH